MGNYWVKLYHEVLDDSKMATLPDRLWRRVVELFLIAGRNGPDGSLPETSQIAWILRCSTDDLEMDLKQIEATGIIRKTVSGWMVDKFAQRQAPVTPAERMRQKRERDQLQQYYGNVTKSNSDVTQIRREEINRLDSELETDKSAVGAVFRTYESEIGMLTPAIADEIKDATVSYPAEWVIQAIKESSKQNKRSWKYASAILKRWKVDGFQTVKVDQSLAGYTPAN